MFPLQQNPESHRWHYMYALHHTTPMPWQQAVALMVPTVWRSQCVLCGGTDNTGATSCTLPKGEEGGQEGQSFAWTGKLQRVTQLRPTTSQNNQNVKYNAFTRCRVGLKAYRLTTQMWPISLEAGPHQSMPGQTLIVIVKWYASPS